MDDLYYLVGTPPYPRLTIPPMPSALVIINLAAPFRTSGPRWRRGRPLTPAFVSPACEPDDMPDDHPDARWGVVANVVEERLYGTEGEIRSGTKHFSPGTKVHYVSAYWGMGGEQVTVLGLARGSRRWITIDLDVRVLENWRAKVIYEPAVLRRLADSEELDQEKAESIAAALSFESSERRVRLVERAPYEVAATADEAERSGTAVLRAPTRGATGVPGRTGFVLYDGAAPVAGATLWTYEGVRPGSWAWVWVARDRHDALADLIVRVQRHASETDLFFLLTLVHELRLARERAGEG